MTQHNEWRSPVYAEPLSDAKIQKEPTTHREQLFFVVNCHVHINQGVNKEQRVMITFNGKFLPFIEQHDNENTAKNIESKHGIDDDPSQQGK